MQKEYIYDLISNFLKLLSEKDFKKLNEQYHLTKAVYEEILEELGNSSIENKNLTLANKEIAMKELNEYRAIFELYSMNNKNEYGIECAIFADEKITDLILEGNIYQKNNKIEFIYKSIRA